MFLGMLTFGKHSWETMFIGLSTFGNIAGKHCFLVFPSSGNIAGKHCFLVCSPSGNIAGKQCLLVCPPSENIAGKQCFLVFPSSGNMARKQCITMCPPGCRHNGFIATPELGHRMYGYTLWGRIALWSHQSAQTASSELCIVQIVNVKYRLSANPRECSNCMSSERNLYFMNNRMSNNFCSCLFFQRVLARFQQKSF